MDFFDRIDERKRFERFLGLREGALACLYGRRRVGKSRLLEEVARGRDNIVFFVADRSGAALQRGRLAKDISVRLEGFADVVYDQWGTLLERWRKDAPAGSVLVLDEFPYLAQQSPELPSVLQRIADGIRESGQKIILCGSSQRMMQGLVLRENEPLYGRAREIVKLEPLSFRWTKEAFPGLSAWERFKRYAVWGGVPRYWEACQGFGGLRETLRELVFSPQGVFHDEPNFILQDDLADAVQASSILSLIGQGVERPGEIAGRLRIPATALGRPLKRLMDLGLARREIPFGNDPKSNKKTLYRLSDPFLRFWYTFVLPNYSDAHFLSTPAEAEAIRPAFRVFLGQAWEALVREELQGKPLPEGTGRWRKASRWWGTGLDGRQMEIDIVAESTDGRDLLVGEAKLSLPEGAVARVSAELEAKAKQLPFANHYRRILPRVFVAEGPRKGTISLDWCEGEG